MVENPIRIIFSVVKEERNDLTVLLSYTLFSSFLSLVVPLAAQVLINSLAAGVLVNPLVVISFLVFVGLLLYGLFQIAQIVIVEKLQQRIFAKISIKLATHIPQVALQELKQKYTPSIVNRFFEIMTLQNSFSKMLIHWPSAILQITIGLVLIWIYSIYLLAFSIFIIIFIFIVYLLGQGGVDTSISESSEKYNFADWLGDLARCHFTFKMISSWSFVHDKTDRLILEYLYARKKHFKIILRQYIAYYIFYAAASVGVLAIGGWLVINHKLSLGQLVASELIIINILRAAETIMNFIDNYYDLIAGIDKIKSILAMKTEKDEGERLHKDYIDIKCKKLCFEYDKNKILDNINIHIPPGQRISLIGKSGSGKTSLTNLLSGSLEPTYGHIYINDIDIKEYNLADLRSKISIINNPNEIFKGTIKENIIISDPDCSREKLNEILELVELTDDIDNFSNGLETILVNEGLNICLGQRLKILIARAIIKDPYLLILDAAFLSIDEKTKNNIIKAIYDRKNKWTVIDISHDYAAVAISDYIYGLDKNIIIEQGTPQELFSNPNGFIKSFFIDKKT